MIIVMCICVHPCKATHVPEISKPPEVLKFKASSRDLGLVPFVPKFYNWQFAYSSICFTFWSRFGMIGLSVIKTYAKCNVFATWTKRLCGHTQTRIYIHANMQVIFMWQMPWIALDRQALLIIKPASCYKFAKQHIFKRPWKGLKHEMSTACPSSRS